MTINIGPAPTPHRHCLSLNPPVAPDPAIEEITGPIPNPLACLTTGVAQTTYMGTLEIGT